MSGENSSVRPFAYIPEPEIKAYAKTHKLAPLDAYRDLFSQKLFDKLDEGEIEFVLRELVKQVVGSGSKGVLTQAKELPN